MPPAKVLLRGACLWPLLTVAATLLGQGRITLAGDQFIDEYGQPFFPMVMNYYVNYAWYPTAPDPHPDLSGLGNCYMAQSSLYGAQGSYSYTNVNDGPDRIHQDLYEMKLLGFNTIRLVMTPIKKQGTGFLISVNKFSPPGSAQFAVDINLDPPYDPSLNPVAAFHFNSVLTFCNLAKSLDMKVLLIAADSPGDFPELIHGNAGSTEIADYSAYLLALAQFLLENHATNLLGYDVYGEPGLAEIGKLKYTPEGMHTKKEICDIVDEWCTAIHAGDSQALITAGGGLMDDGMAGGWDPELSKVDFATFHIYPDQTEWEFNADPTTFRQKMIDRYNNQLYVMDRTLHKPYIIAETSYPAHDGSYPYVYPVSVYGSEADQDNFVQQTFPVVRATRACGYAWWDFQDKHWFPDPPFDPSVGFDNYREDYMGLLNYGDPGPMDMANGISGYEPYRKQAAWTFASYALNPPAANPTTYGPVSPTVDMSETYYNPYGHPENTTSVYVYGRNYYGTLTGHVQDQQSESPMVGVVVRGTCEVGHDNNHNMMFHTSYTFTDENGNFILRGFDTDPSYGTAPPNDGRDQCIMDLKIGTYGAGWIQYGEWDGSNPIQQDQTYVMHTVSQLFDGDLDGITVGLTENQPYDATNSLTAHQFLVEGDGVSQGGTSALKATYQIHLSPGFHAEKGSVMHAYTSPVHIDCGAVQAGDLRSMGTTDDGGMLPSDERQRSIALVLHPDLNTEDFQVMPNPSDGHLTVNWNCASCASETGTQLTITNAIGMVVFQGSVNLGTSVLDLRPIAPGSYNVSIRFQNQVLTRRIIIQ